MNKKVKDFTNEFKTFISKGNVLDLAVAVILGGAFGKIITSLVNDVIMPIIGIILGGIHFSNLSISVGGANIMYGSFIQQIVDFLIIAFCIFVLVKALNKVQKKKEVKKEAEKEEVTLLKEIRDLLKNKKA